MQVSKRTRRFGKRLPQRCRRKQKADPLRVQQISLDFMQYRSERRGDFSCDGVILYHTLAKDGALPSGYETEFAALCNARDNSGRTRRQEPHIANVEEAVWLHFESQGATADAHSGTNSSSSTVSSLSQRRFLPPPPPPDVMELVTRKISAQAPTHAVTRKKQRGRAGRRFFSPVSELADAHGRIA